MHVLLKIPMLDYVTGENYEENLLNFLEDADSKIALNNIKGSDAEEEFLEGLSSTFDQDSEYAIRFLTSGSFQTLITVFGADKTLKAFDSIVETLSLPDESAGCDGDCDNCDKKDTKDPVTAEDIINANTIVNEFTWHSEAVFDVLGNNEDTIKGRLLGENVVEVYCNQKNPILKKNVLHRVHMGQRVSADSLIFDVEDGILRISISEPEPEVLLF